MCTHCVHVVCTHVHVWMYILHRLYYQHPGKVFTDKMKQDRLKILIFFIEVMHAHEECEGVKCHKTPQRHVALVNHVNLQITNLR